MLASLEPAAPVTKAVHPSREMQRRLRDAGIPAIVTQRRGTQVFDLEFQGDLENFNGRGTLPAREWAAQIRRCFKCTITNIQEDCRAEWRPGCPVIMTGLTIEGDLTPKVTSAGKRRVNYAYLFSTQELFSMDMGAYYPLEIGETFEEEDDLLDDGVFEDDINDDDDFDDDDEDDTDDWDDPDDEWEDDEDEDYR